MTNSECIRKFREKILSIGLTPPEHIVPGTTYRFPGIGKSNGNKAGWCKLNLDGKSGCFGDHSSGIKHFWRFKSKYSPTMTYRKTMLHNCKEVGQHSEGARRKEQELAAEKAKEMWDAAQPAQKDHPYLVKKRIFAHGIRQSEGRLIVPLKDMGKKIWALHLIDSDGNKWFYPKGCRTKGLSFKLGKKFKDDNPICIAEGFATAIAIFESTGNPIAVAFSAGNMEPVAQSLKEKYPGNSLVLCADDDRKDDTTKNPGIEAATKAALAVGGLLAVPGLESKADFWDLWDTYGPEAVKLAIDNAQSVEKDNDGDITQENPDAIIKHLASISIFEYEQKRKEFASKLNMRAGALDKAVDEARQGKDDSADFPFKETEPWPEPIDPGELLNDIAATIKRFIVCSDEISNAATLWIAFTWFVDVVQVAPLAVITSPEKRCGKSQLLSLLSRLSSRSITASNISPAALYRSIEAWKPTLLIDEADACLKDNEELRGIINSGHTRDSAYVARIVGDKYIPTLFSTWGAKAIAGIGHVAETLLDRAIVLELRRKLPSETAERIREVDPELFDVLRKKLARFAENYSEHIRNARPYLPESLNDRAKDNWEPLLAIAEVAGWDWVKIGRNAASKLSGDDASSVISVGSVLLSDIKEVFDKSINLRISIADFSNVRLRTCMYSLQPRLFPQGMQKRLLDS